VSAGAGTLHVVSTPIGHLGDLSPRAVEVLQHVTAILAEDTRHTRILCDRFAIRTPLLAYHEHNEASRVPGLVARLVAGESFALVSDAGTPLLSDPGDRLVRAAIAAGVTVSPVPGPSALLAALVVSGLPDERFTFLGFLARKGRERSEAIETIVAAPHTVVLYEAPARVAETLRALEAAGAGARPAVLARELTKQFETIVRGTVREVAAAAEAEPPRGEVVLVIGAGAPEALDPSDLERQAAAWRAEGQAPREVMRRLMEERGAPRNLAYRIAHA
jgi:16S rRNA (cytidine1402-2'-O)-methyltransferase